MTPPTALAPMQDVTTLPFMRLIASYGAPNWFVTEYFRVHGHSTLEAHILASITENDTGRPVYAQLIGESLPDIRRTVEALTTYPIAGIDLNLGCPAPKVYKKQCGGGLLRNPAHVERIFALLREISPNKFTVKMRLGFEDTRNLDELLGLVAKYEVDLLSVHGRTVKGGYRSEVDYDLIRHAVASVPGPVLANGEISSVAKAQWVLEHTGCHGLMIGRHAIRNPWIFRQIREHFSGESVVRPTLGDVFGYVRDLYATLAVDGMDEVRHVARMKKFLNFVGQGVDPEGQFLYEMRRTRTEADLFTVCERWLADRAEELFPAEPHAGVVARPNREAQGCEL